MWQTNEKLDDGETDALHKKIAIVQYNSKTKQCFLKLIVWIQFMYPK